MKVSDLVKLKGSVEQLHWNDKFGLILAIVKPPGWKDNQAYVYWPSENKVWTFSVLNLEVISESR